MKLSELRKLAPINPDPEINTTEELEHYFFGKPYKLGGKDYRQQAIDFSIKHRLAILTTANNEMELMRKFIRVKCPMCRKYMFLAMGSGSGRQYTGHYRCACGNASLNLTINMPYGIVVDFKELENDKDKGQHNLAGSGSHQG